jgi:dihydrofolate reductase
MRKVLFFMLTSLDGYFEGPSHELDWHHVDDEIEQFILEQLKGVDTLLFGRVTYEMMAAYWSSPNATHEDPVVAGFMNSLPKIVFSNNLDVADWNNTRLVKDDFAGEVTRLKGLSGRDMIIFGSSDLALTFLQANLLDELRIMVNPVVLGSGKALFQGMQGRLELKLLKARAFKNGSVLLFYQPLPKPGA